MDGDGVAVSGGVAVKPPQQQQLKTAQDLFIRRWGEMGQTWGINRTMAEIHAFLYITGMPQCTDDVMERLNISRGNASMSLRALCDWGIIRRLHRRGERREYFESLSDVWEIFSIIAAERKRREMDPVLETIKQCQRMLEETELGKAAAKSEAVQTDPPAAQGHAGVHGGDEQDLPAVRQQRPGRVEQDGKPAVEGSVRWSGPLSLVMGM